MEIILSNITKLYIYIVPKSNEHPLNGLQNFQKKMFLRASAGSKFRTLFDAKFSKKNPIVFVI